MISLDSGIEDFLFVGLVFPLVLGRACGVPSLAETWPVLEQHEDDSHHKHGQDCSCRPEHVERHDSQVTLALLQFQVSAGGVGVVRFVPVLLDDNGTSLQLCQVQRNLAVGWFGPDGN